MNNERIVCSAIEITNVSDDYNNIYLGLRHGDCFKSIAGVRKLLKHPDEWRVKCIRNAEQGFLTTKNRFVNREDAMVIARRQDQVIEEFGNGRELYSECLY